ncbi:MAG: putative beta-lysine N-acetyltransferase [Thermoanaerobacterales bacterium]|nr:putative beta-lysine N-acetyltransferase [Bacillota bacterium]MDI6906587.1 putative beta-lysine N-acetyltransferase [Thermoanaerobacterales bacterium]
MLFLNEAEIVQRKGKGFTARVHVDQANERLWIIDYTAWDAAALAGELTALAGKHGCGKIVFPCVEAEAAVLAEQGFLPEARVPGFFRGRTAVFLARYLSRLRATSPRLQDEQRLLDSLAARARREPPEVRSPLPLRRAGPDDAPALARLFGTVFMTYPTPVHDPDYLRAAMAHGALFVAAVDGGRLVAAAAAETDLRLGHAEITDCATLPAHQGRGLGTALVTRLEEECRRGGCTCLYSLARAFHPGVNKVFHRLGYEYGGTLVQNARIGPGGYEDLNVWVKYRPAAG